MTTDDPQARALERWLAATPGARPPDDLESDVVEAVYALRPDLAPAPRLTADDILASLDQGPLASTQVTKGSQRSGVAEVVPFPKRPAPEVDETVASSEDASANRRRFPVRTGWIVALVAAATLLVVLQTNRAGAPAPAASEAPPAAPASAASPQAAPPVVAAEVPPAQRKLELPVRQIAEQPREEAVGPLDDPSVFDMDSEAALAPDELIPEVAAARTATALADEAALGEGAAPSPPPPAAAQAPAAVGLVAPIANVEEEVAAEDRRKAKDDDGYVSDPFVQAAELRARGELREAANTLATLVKAPASTGLVAARLAALDYLALGDARAAEKVARKGLALGGEGTQARAELEAVYQQALSALAPNAAAPLLDAAEAPAKR